MAQLEPLISINELKANRLKAEKGKKPVFSIHYDDDLDTLILRLLEPQERTAVYFVDDLVGLIFEIDSHEVIGFHIDYFVEEFLPAHEGVEQAWRLTNASQHVHDFGELILAFEQMKPRVADEVARATSDVLRPQAQQLAEALLAA